MHIEGYSHSDIGFETRCSVAGQHESATCRRTCSSVQGRRHNAVQEPGVDSKSEHNITFQKRTVIGMMPTATTATRHLKLHPACFDTGKSFQVSKKQCPKYILEPTAVSLRDNKVVCKLHELMQN